MSCSLSDVGKIVTWHARYWRVGRSHPQVCRSVEHCGVSCVYWPASGSSSNCTRCRWATLHE